MREQREAYLRQEKIREESLKKQEVRKRKLLGLDSETEEEAPKIIHSTIFKNEQDHPFYGKDPRNMYVQDNYKFKEDRFNLVKNHWNTSYSRQYSPPKKDAYNRSRFAYKTDLIR